MTFEIVFVATEGRTGPELWRSDGTPDGTQLLRDIREGEPGILTGLPDGRVVLSAVATGLGREVWITDGTPEGTVLLGDLFPGPPDSNPGSFTLLRIVAPEAPVINPVAGDDVIGAAALAAGIRVSGTAEPGVAVTVTLGGATRTATADEEGAWSVRFGPGAFPGDGPATLEAVATNASGGVSAPATRAVEIDSTLGVTLVGTRGADALEGTDGNDRLEGRGGDDTLIGGAGADTFVFRRGHESAVIRDFDTAGGDRLLLGAGLLGAAGSGQQVVDAFARVNRWATPCPTSATATGWCCAASPTSPHSPAASTSPEVARRLTRPGCGRRPARRPARR